jgi:hypothetical protein
VRATQPNSSKPNSSKPNSSNAIKHEHSGTVHDMQASKAGARKTLQVSCLRGVFRIWSDLGLGSDYIVEVKKSLFSKKIWKKTWVVNKEKLEKNLKENLSCKQRKAVKNLKENFKKNVL